MQLEINNLQFILTCFQLVVTVAGFILIKFNDLRHLEKDFKDIKKTLDKNTESIANLHTDVAVIFTKLENITENK